MNSAVIIAGIGLFQLISYFVGFGPGYNFDWFFNKWGVIPGGLGLRINSVFSEPAYYAAAMAPAFFVAIYNFTNRNTLWVSRKQSALIAVVYLLTYSSLGILGVMLTLVFLLLNMGFVRYGLAIIPILIFGTQWAYVNVPEFRDRIDGTNELVETQNIYSYDVHGSSFVLYNNSHVAWENFIRNPILGTGLGSHATAFEKYSFTNLDGAVQIDFNSQDANSLFLRLMSETGIYGLGLMLYLLFRCWIFSPKSFERENWVISNGLVIIIVIYLVRQGHYFYNGFPFFLWLYYYNFEINAAQRKAAEEALNSQNKTNINPLALSNA
jgi:O-antigen ligase